MGDVALRLLVLRTGRVEAARAFYRALGVPLVEERHGSGPLHYAGRVGETVLELYPLATGTEPDTTTRLGFAVPSLAGTLAALDEQEPDLVAGPQQTTWGRRALLRDPDGRTVEIYES